MQNSSLMAGRHPVRACFALAGAGSLGTFISGAVTEIVLAIRAHNLALADPQTQASDPRLLHPHWGRITVDAVGGASAGALCAGQLIKSLFEPDYLGEGKPIDEPGTITGDWIQNASFEALSIEGNQPQQADDVEAPGWTLLNATKLYEVALNALRPASLVELPPHDAGCPIPDHGLVGVGITLTDLLGHHEHVDFDARHVLGHPSYGAPTPRETHNRRLAGKEVRDLGVKNHAEIRRYFISRTDASHESVERYLEATGRTGQAHGLTWREAFEHLAKMAAASAALPLALGPVAVTDRNLKTGVELKRIYMDGGMLNNKPLSPALQISRWQDELRLLGAVPPDAESFPTDTVEETLDYQRVCFFLDAFPDRTRGEWRSPHPNTALEDPDAVQLRPENVEARNARIDEALQTPVAGLALFLDSLLTSLRAQDIRGVANTNLKIESRRQFIRKMAERGLVGRPDFLLRDFESVHAFAAVSDALRGMNVSLESKFALTDLLQDAQSFSGTESRREVTMVPVYAPENLAEVLAGEAVYAVGGLLSKEARIHDATVGRKIARTVLASLKPGPKPDLVLDPTPEEARPKDSSLLVERLRTTILATIEGNGARQTFLKRLVAVPVKLNPLVNLLKTRLDSTIRGDVRSDGGSK